MKCDVCGGPMASTTVENDIVRDRRMRRKHYHNTITVCEKCKADWYEKLHNVRWDTLGGVAREALVP